MRLISHDVEGHFTIRRMPADWMARSSRSDRRQRLAPPLARVVRDFGWDIHCAALTRGCGDRKNA
jgi:hypothetical protein